MRSIVAAAAAWPLLTFLLAAPACALAATVESPSGEIRITVNAGARLTYRVDFKGKPVLDESDLGVTVGGSDLGSGAALGEPIRSTFNETYKILGVKAQGVNHYN